MKQIYFFSFFLFFVFAARRIHAQIPVLNSLPGSSFVLFLDFDGHTDSSGYWTNWGYANPIVTAAAPLSAAQMTEVHTRVSEDFRPFNINVTTQQSVYSAAAVANRQRVGITPGSGFYTDANPNAGGVAYIGTFGGGEIACWVFTNKLSTNASYIAEATSHELGHTLGLQHHARYNSDCSLNTGYHSGQGSGQTSWAPIMGVGYNRNIVQWYHGATTASTCSTGYQDDLKIITTTNGFGYKTDDAGDAQAQAATLNLTGGSGTATGLIATNTDVDVYKFTISNPTTLTIGVAPFAFNTAGFSGANLDVQWALRNSSGTILLISDPIATLDAVSTVSLASGTYYLSIDGTGVADYVATGGIGTMDYGSIGQYTISMTQSPCNAGVLSAIGSGRCGTGTVTLGVTAAQGSSVNWYDAPVGGNLLATGLSFTTPSISVSSTYYVEVSNGNCTSARTPVTAIVTKSPVLQPITGTTSVQIGNTTQLSTTSSGGVWNSANISVASISTAGLVTGLSSGTSLITYSVTTGFCPTSSVSTTVTVTQAAPCPGTPTITDADGNVYNTIQIGTQCWTKENLRTTRFTDNTTIEGISIASSWANATGPAWCYYNSNSQYNATYGKLYNWQAVANNKGLCPAGWHVPDQNEYTTAQSFLGGATVAGGKLKSVSALWAMPNTGATDASGFGALPGGQRQAGGTFSGISTEAGFWTLAPAGSTGFRYFLSNDTQILSSFSEQKKTGLSVRCIKNTEAVVPSILQTYGSSSCTTSVMNLYAVPSTGVVYWYDVPTGGEVLATGNSFTTPELSTTTTYYAEAVIGNLVSNTRVPVVATINSTFVSGTLVLAPATICNGGDPASVNFATMPSGSAAYRYQWYFADGLQSCPTGFETNGWTLIEGATSSSYDPAPGLLADRTYAVFVSPMSGVGGTGQEEACGVAQWATGCRQISVLPPFSPGTITSGDQTFCNQGNPANITLSANPTGSGSYSWRWYFRESPNGNCPTGSSVSGGWATNSTSPNITGTTTTGEGISFDPTSAGTTGNGGRTFAVLVTPTANGSIPACGTPQWASGCRRTFVSICNFLPGTLASGNQTMCHGGDPSAINFSVSPSGATGYAAQWYYRDGIITAPTGSATSGWTALAGATSLSYDPPSGLVSSRTFACFVVPTGGTGQWASGCRQITVSAIATFGGLAAGNQTLTAPADPAQVVFSTQPTGGSGNFNYQWYLHEGLVSAPVGSVTTGWVAIPNAVGTSYDPPAGLQNSRTFACLVTPTGNPACGPASWAEGCRQVTVNVALNPGVLAQGNQTICYAGDAGAIQFSTLPSGGDIYTPAWYFIDGIVAAPQGSSTIGWTRIGGASQYSYDPPAGLTQSRTYACFVSEPGGGGLWASGVRQVVVLPVFDPGTIAAGDQSFCNQGDPANITLSVNPSGSGAYTWRWYYRENATGACPIGNTVSPGWATNSTSPNITGTTTTGTGISFDPQNAGSVNKGRTFAVFITPKANGAMPACGTPSWANSCRRTFVTPCAASESMTKAWFRQLMTIFPNPVEKRFQVLLPGVEPGSVVCIEIFDSKGTRVCSIQQEAEAEGLTLEVADLRPGVYQLLANEKDKTWKGRLLKE